MCSLNSVTGNMTTQEDDVYVFNKMRLYLFIH